MRVAIGSDHAGFHLKGELCTLLDELRIEYRDFGTFDTQAVDYPDAIAPVACAVARGDFDRGIVLGGSGTGEAIVANKVRGIRCVEATDPVTALLGREHNDANVLSMGARIVGIEVARACVRAFLDGEFAGGRHQPRWRRSPGSRRRRHRADPGAGRPGLGASSTPSTGTRAAFAMRIVLRAAEATGATELIYVTRAHVDSCLYHGEATIDFVARLVDGRGGCAIPTTLNVGAVDLLHPELIRATRGSRARAAADGPIPRARRAADLHLRPVPGCRRHARLSASRSPGASRTPSPSATRSSAPERTGRVTSSTSRRRSRAAFPLPASTGPMPGVPRCSSGWPRTSRRRSAMPTPFPVLGDRRRAARGSAVAAIDGLPPGQSEDRLKALGAAAASSGAVAMFHVVGSTPEALTSTQHSRVTRRKHPKPSGSTSCDRRATS